MEKYRDKRAYDYVKNILNYFLELIIEKDVKCLNFREFFIHNSRLPEYR